MAKQAQTHRGETALITGASSGFGAEFAKLFAHDGYNLVLVARSEGALNILADQLRAKYGVQVRVLPKDLALPAAPGEIFATLRDKTIPVDVLVNNAGFATYGPFAEIALQTEMDMLKVNMLALTHLTKLFLPGMLAQRRGKILNVASTAAFQPGPLMAAYYATKAYVLFLSEAIAEEVRGSGVTVTALCPGPARTGFQRRAQMEDSRLVSGRIMDARTVAVAGYRAMQQGRTVVIPGLRNRLFALAPRVSPRGLAARVVKKMQVRVAH
jgi:short-subunit dehydrogenase